MPITGKQIADGAITSSKLAGALSAQNPIVLDKDLVTSPVVTVIGDKYIVAGLGGSWAAGAINDIAEALDITGTLWDFVTPTEGASAWVLDEDCEYIFTGASWEYQLVTEVVGFNTYIGVNAGNSPVSVGAGALSNVVMGFAAAGALSTGSDNVVLGRSAAAALSTGNLNILLGSTVAPALSLGASNIILGSTAGASVTTGSLNVILGNTAAAITSEDANIIIGVDAVSIAASRHMDIGGTLMGNLLTKQVRVGGSGALSAGAIFEVENAAPTVRLNETGAAADEKLWQLESSSGVLGLVAYTDAGASGDSAISIARTGTALDTISFGANQEFVVAPNPADETEAVVGINNGGTNGANVEIYVGDVTPIGSVTANPGDIYLRSQAGVLSNLYVHQGAVSDDTSWGPAVVSASQVYQFGSEDVQQTVTVRYLTPGYENTVARTTAVQFRAPRAGTLRNLYVQHNTVGGGANDLDYTVRVNSVATTIVANLAATAASGEDTVNTAAVSAGDSIDIEVTKPSGALGGGNEPSIITATLELS
jgi:hypothetical protein